MIIHKLLICITAAIPLGFNLSLIVMPYISLHCASSDKRWANSFGKKRTRLHTRCIIHVTMFLCSTKSMHLLMCSLGEVWIEEGWRPDGTAGSGYLLKLRICPYSQSRWCLWQVDGARAGKAEAQDGKGELGWTWPITTPLSLGFRWTRQEFCQATWCNGVNGTEGQSQSSVTQGPQGCCTQSIQNRFTESLT